MLIGIDIGGTFTDIVFADRSTSRLTSLKVPSREGELEKGVERGLKSLAERQEIDFPEVERIVHGTTVVTNALLEGQWGRTALITTEGFRDVLEIGRQNRPVLYDFGFELPEPVVPRDLRYEVKERIGPDGEVIEPLDEDSLTKVVEEIKDGEVDAVAVSLLFSYANPAHERKVVRLLREKVEAKVSSSSFILPEFREYERTSTTALNAALRPVMGDYLKKLERKSAGQGFRKDWEIMQSNGGITTSRNAEEKPVRMVLSGPAAGVEGATFLGEEAGFSDLITLDMGGTSCDVSLIRGGEAEITTKGEIAGHPIGAPMIDIHTIGSGGGSIAWIDDGGALRVGPESAGARPGPVCYGRGGTEPTVTDAHLLLGRIDPENALGALQGLDLDSARAAIGEKIAKPLGMEVEEAAAGIIAIADANMERAIRVISVDRGEDPRDFALLAFGGAGPLHSVELASKLGMSKVIIPAQAGVLSALGLLETELTHDLGHSVVQRLDRLDASRLREEFESLMSKGREILLAEGVPPRRIEYEFSADLRYLGQSHELTLKLEKDEFLKEMEIAQSFHEKHASLYGHSRPEAPVELVNVRLKAVGKRDKFDFDRSGEGELKDARLARRSVYFQNQGWKESTVYDRGSIPAGKSFRGPAVLKGEESTVLVPPQVKAFSDGMGNLVLSPEVG